eukprot:g4745.t1
MWMREAGLTPQQVAKRDMSNWKGPTDEQVEQAFLAFDVDGSGDIDEEEVKWALNEFWGIDLTPDEVRSIFILYDDDGNGTLDIDEFACMLKNLDDLDPGSVSRFWSNQYKNLTKGIRKGAGNIGKEAKTMKSGWLSAFACCFGGGPGPIGDEEEDNEDGANRSASGGRAANPQEQGGANLIAQDDAAKKKKKKKKKKDGRNGKSRPGKKDKKKKAEKRPSFLMYV